MSTRPQINSRQLWTVLAWLAIAALAVAGVAVGDVSLGIAAGVAAVCALCFGFFPASAPDR